VAFARVVPQLAGATAVTWTLTLKAWQMRWEQLPTTGAFDMNTTTIKNLMTLALLAAGGAAAAGTVNGSAFTNNTSSATLDGIGFTAAGGGGSFEKKAAGSYIGVGVKGATAGEIDVGERITGTWTGLREVESFTLGLLYNGDRIRSDGKAEYDDWAEIAKVSILQGSTWVHGLLRTTADDHIAQWSFGGTTVNVAAELDAVTDKGAVWKVTDPFGEALASGIRFEAKTSAYCVDWDSKCSNQSDYNLVQVVTAPVPEPGTYALMLAGLSAVGFVARRRRPA